MLQVYMAAESSDASEDVQGSSDSEDADMADEEEDLPRYSRRNRALVQRYSPKAAQEGTFNVGLKRRRSIAEQVPNSSAHARVQLSSRQVCCRGLCCDSWPCEQVRFRLKS